MLGGLHNKVPDILRVEFGAKSERRGLVLMDPLFHHLDKHWGKGGREEEGAGRVGESKENEHKVEWNLS